MVGWLFCFTVYQPFASHLTPNLVILIKVSNNSVKYKYSFFYLYMLSVLFLTIQFSISTQFEHTVIFFKKIILKKSV